MKQISTSLHHPIQHCLRKRLFDLCFSFFILLLLAPFFLFIAVAICITSRGPIFYTHLRVGRGGKLFRCFKFRTMYTDAQERLREILHSSPELRHEWEETHKLKKDPRITPVGNFLRKTSLDELPQFWNVIRGDLSVVGPRPVVEEEIVKHFGLKAAKILSVRPGITGIWQTSGRNDISYEARIRLDEQYVDERSIALDLKLILKTIPCMISSKGAY